MGLTVGELVGYLDLDADPFRKGLDRAMADGEKAGKKMEQVGGKMTRGLTLPLLAAGGAAVKLGTDYDTAFARMVGLAGVPQAEVDGLKQSVLDLAGETAVAPQELADALYFAASAGLDAAGAMDAVTFAAKASAAGMGQAQEIVGLVASAVASYGAANIDAARATDILTAAVRQGRADPEELAGSLGRVLPVAAQLGISFEEVGGAVAFLSNVFGDTNRTVTSLSGLLVKLVSPTKGGIKALEDMGTSVEELQSAIDQDGLMGALDLLREKGFAGNQQALRALFDDIEGYQGALALLNDESGSLAGTMDKVAGSTGALGDAFDAVADTDGFKMKQALTDLQVAAIQAGDVIGPFVATVASGIGTVAQAFASLPGPAQTVVLAFLGILAAVGPLTTVGGKLLTNWKTISSTFSKIATEASWAKDGMTGAAGGTAKFGRALGALGLIGAVGGLAYLASTLSRTKVDVDKAALALANLSDAQAEQIQQAILAGEHYGKLDEMVRQLADGNVIAADRFLEQAAAAGITGDRLAELTAIVDDKRESDVQGAKDQAEYAAEVQGAVGPTDELTGALEEQAPAVDKVAEAFDGLLEAVLAQFDSNIGYRRSLDSTEDALGKLAMTAADGKSSQEDLERATLDAEDAMLAQAAAAVRLAEDQAIANGEIFTGEDKARLYKEELYRLAGTLEPGSPLFLALVGYMQQLDGIPADVKTVVIAETATAESMIAALKRSIESVPKTVAIGFIGPLLPGQTRTGRPNPPTRHSGGIVPGGLQQEVDMRLLGGETVRTVDQERSLQQQIMGGGATTRPGGTAVTSGAPTVIVEIPVILDGRRIGSSSAVIEGMDSVRAVRDRNGGGT